MERERHTDREKEREWEREREGRMESSFGLKLCVQKGKLRV